MTYRDTDTMRHATSCRLGALALVLALAACGSDGPSPDSDSRQAEGEVLEGSISDDMIPLDQLRSRGASADAEDLAEDGATDASDSDTAAATDDADDDAAGEETADTTASAEDADVVAD